jgi:uracil-DNA glycosylase family 4
VNHASEAGRRVLLNRLYRRYAEDPAFSVLRQGDNPLVPGTGSLFPRLFFIGEAPGRREATHRRPFVGASGELLDEMLTSVGLHRDDVFITNTVKYRPTEGKSNRTPTDAEVYASLPYLRAEHRLLGLPPLVALGKHAKRVAERDYKLPHGLTIGKWFWMNDGYPILPLYHPAYGIYQRANRPLMFDQFKAVLTPPAHPGDINDA